MAVYLLPMTAFLLAVAVLFPLAVAVPAYTCGSLDQFGDTEDCTIYYQCVHGAPVQMRCAPGTHWSDHYQPGKCVHKYSEEDFCTLSNFERECDAAGVSFTMPDPYSCHAYYACEYRAPGDISINGYECPDRGLYDATVRKCLKSDYVHCSPNRINIYDETQMAG